MPNQTFNPQQSKIIQARRYEFYGKTAEETNQSLVLDRAQTLGIILLSFAIHYIRQQFTSSLVFVTSFLNFGAFIAVCWYSSRINILMAKPNRVLTPRFMGGELGKFSREEKTTEDYRMMVQCQ